jgi:hypothetical protein
MDSGQEWEHAEFWRTSGNRDCGNQQNSNSSPENNPA